MPFAEDATEPGCISESIKEDPLVYDADTNVDSVTKDFLASLLAKNRDDRMTTAAEIKSHRYFQNMYTFLVLATVL
jgi:hypothetical protein